MYSLSREFAAYIQSKSPDYLDSRAIAFIDPRIDRWESLVQQVAPEVRVFVLELTNSGIDTVTQTLSNSSCCQIYLVAAGSPGTLKLGASELSRNTLIQHEAKLQNWFARINSSCVPCIHISGCNVAAGDVGAEFIERLSSIIGAEIACSANVYATRIFN